MKKESKKKYLKIYLLLLSVLFFIFSLRNINGQAIPQPLYWYPFDNNSNEYVNHTYNFIYTDEIGNPADVQ